MQSKIDKLQGRLRCHEQIFEGQAKERAKDWHAIGETVFEIINLNTEIKQATRLLKAQTSVTILRKGDQDADNTELLH
jgi:hypothetical protein